MNIYMYKSFKSTRRMPTDEEREAVGLTEEEAKEVRSLPSPVPWLGQNLAWTEIRALAPVPRMQSS